MNQGGNAGNPGGNTGNQVWNAGNQGGNAENQGGNVGNQGKNGGGIMVEIWEIGGGMRGIEWNRNRKKQINSL